MKTVKLIVAITCLSLWVTAAYAQKSNLSTDTQHGAVGANVCDGCHTPHSGTNATAYLWDNSVGTSTYTVYTSPTMDNTASNFTAPGDGSLTAGDPENNSLLCMSCHDGALAATNGVTLTTGTYGTATNPITGTAIDVGGSGSTTLQNDHPVNMELDPAQDAGLDTVANVTAAGLEVYTGGGATNTVQCGSCHNPHEQGPDGGPGSGYYLRLSQGSGALCLTCHL